MISPELARSIRLVVLDVDGVLTDGGVYLGASGAGDFEFKRYDIQDGLGVYLMRQAGLHVAIITGRVSDSVRIRAAELHIEKVVQDPTVRKLRALKRMTTELGLTLAEVAFVGDDLPDLAVLREVGLPACVGNAVPEVVRACSVKLSRKGGHGAIREFAEMLLAARGEWAEQVERYVSDRAADSGSDAEYGTEDERSASAAGEVR
ncbi:MAG TPA: HAD hydrolase family protein [Gemmatimonadales bacterium]|nr:HAD hydrolase family protein [Gemmatimonadales bacterium]